MRAIKTIVVGGVVAAGLLAYEPAMAQSRGNEAIAVCDAERRSFVELRARYKEAIRNRVIRGVAVGALAGMGVGGYAGRGQSSEGQQTAVILGAIAGGIAGGMSEYISAKKEITDNNREMVRLIDADARSYVGRIQSLTTAINLTGECRQNQIMVWERRLIATRTEFAARQQDRADAMATTPEKDRRRLGREQARAEREDRRILDQMTHEHGLIEAAIKDDESLFSDVLKYFDDDIKMMAEAQAQVEGTSMASLRGSAEAYTVDVIPPAILAGGGSGSASGSAESAFRTSSAPRDRNAVDPSLDLNDASIYRAQIRAPSQRQSIGNGHQAAYVAQRDASAAATAVDQTNRARLRVAVARGSQVNLG